MTRCRERGRAQSMVEFALILPLFIALFLAVIDLGRFMAAYASISSGVRSGARVATIASATDTQIKDAVVAAVIIADSSTVRSSVSISPSTRVALSPVTVSASYTFTFNPLIHILLKTVGPGTLDINQSVTMTVEGP